MEVFRRLKHEVEEALGNGIWRVLLGQKDENAEGSNPFLSD